MTADYESFCEEITLTSVAETVAKLLAYPFGFHGDTGIRDFLYARLHVNGGERLCADDERPGYSTLLLQAEHYTVAKYLSTGKSARGARFDLALVRPPAASAAIDDRCAEKLDALFAFELGKNKAFGKVIDPTMVDHSVETLTGTSDVSKLYRELALHGLQQGWALEFYDSRGGSGASIIPKALEICEGLELSAGRKLVVVFVGFSVDGQHHVSSNDKAVQAELLARLAARGIAARPDLVPALRVATTQQGGHGWGTAALPSATVAEVFGDRDEFAQRIVELGGMTEVGRKSRYVNLSSAGKTNIAQIHPQKDGIGLVLKRRSGNLPATDLQEIPVSSLAGYAGPNARWLDGQDSQHKKKGPAIAYLIPDTVDELGDDDPEWLEVAKFLEHAKTL